MDAMDGVDVQRATPDDLGVLAELQWRWRVAEWSGVAVVDFPGFAAALREWAEKNLESHPAFIARRGDRVLGMGWLAPIERVPTPTHLVRRHGQVQSLYVVPEARDCGVGAALLRTLIDESRRMGCDCLLVHPSERSFRFYRRHGFSGSGDFLSLRLTDDAATIGTAEPPTGALTARGRDALSSRRSPRSIP
jgi:GNAT superfamily N-acetyltransferase